MTDYFAAENQHKSRRCIRDSSKQTRQTLPLVCSPVFQAPMPHPQSSRLKHRKRKSGQTSPTRSGPFCDSATPDHVHTSPRVCVSLVHTPDGSVRSQILYVEQGLEPSPHACNLSKLWSLDAMMLFFYVLYIDFVNTLQLDYVVALWFFEIIVLSKNMLVPYLYLATRRNAIDAKSQGKDDEVTFL